MSTTIVSMKSKVVTFFTNEEKRAFKKYSKALVLLTSKFAMDAVENVILAVLKIFVAVGIIAAGAVAAVCALILSVLN